jgi:hypothetical protein
MSFEDLVIVAAAPLTLLIVDLDFQAKTGGYCPHIFLRNLVAIFNIQILSEAIFMLSVMLVGGNDDALVWLGNLVDRRRRFMMAAAVFLSIIHVALKIQETAGFSPPAV